MKNSLVTEFFRSIKCNKGRFLALLGIVAMGAGFFGGLNMVSPDMRLSNDAYNDGCNMMDLRLVSTLGIDSENIDKIKQIEGVDEVMPDKTADAIGKVNGIDFVARITSLPEAAYTSTVEPNGYTVNSDPEKGSYINRQILVEGSWPSSKDECVILSNAVLNTNLGIGDEITLSLDGADIEKTLTSKKLKVTGLVKSPSYVCNTALGQTSVGAGRVQQALFVRDETFKENLPFTELLITVKDAKKYTTGSDKYKDAVGAVNDQISEICPNLADERTKRIRKEITDIADKGKTEADKKLKEIDAMLAQAQDKINSTKVQIESAELELEDAKRELAEQLANLKALENATFEELDKTKAQLNETQSAISSINLQLANLQTQQKSLLATISQGYTPETSSHVRNYATCILNEKTCVDSMISILKSMGDFPDAVYALDVTSKVCAEVSIIASDFANAIDAQGEPAYNEDIESFCDADESLTLTFDYFYTPVVAEMSSTIDGLIKQCDEAYTTAKQKFEEGYKQIDEATALLSTKTTELENGKAKWQQGNQEYLDSKAKVAVEFADVYKKLNEVYDSANLIETADFYVLDRTKDAASVSYDGDCERIKNIATVFPLFFFVVAALVALTTMTRMIDEERVLVGTYKAIGIYRRTIAARYVAYGVIVSLIGAIIGIAILSQVLPAVVMIAYSIIYSNPAMLMPIDFPIALASTGISVVLVALVTLFSCMATLCEVPAALMQAAAPKPGKRILLERINFLWRRLSFVHKVTLRNLFRYKKRLLMTMFGIAGCFALLLTGFGLHDSINDIIDVNYTDIVHDNTQVMYSENISEESNHSFAKLLSDKNYCDEFLAVNSTNYSVQTTSDKSLTTTLITTNSHRISDFRTLRSRTEYVGPDGSIGGLNNLLGPLNIGGVKRLEYRFDLAKNDHGITYKSLEDNYIDENGVWVVRHGAIISEKIANKCNLKVGDKLKLYKLDAIGNPTNDYYEVDIAAICENYVANYIYMAGPDFRLHAGSYEGGTLTSAVDQKNNMVMAQITDNPDLRNEFSVKAREIKGVNTVIYTDESVATYRRMLSSVDMVVLVLIVCAGILAFIVLYNLTNINITERKRELATLKVLGFTSRETNAYIHRETLISTLLGILVGIVFGIWLEGFVITSAEVDMVMFGRIIHLLSYVYSALITVIFTIFVIAFMRGKIKKINMVESLKSID